MISTPVCHGMTELPSASEERARLNQYPNAKLDLNMLSPLAKHVALGLAVTTGSAVGEEPPSTEELLESFEAPNSVGLSAGARAWTKHAHRSGNTKREEITPQSDSGSSSWWGTPKGPIASLNANALEIFHKIIQSATWRNLHWLPHEVLVYEVRVEEGYGMRWSQDHPASSRSAGTTTSMTGLDSGDSTREDAEDAEEDLCKWVFRGFVEPMMENGHEVGWRH